MKDRKQGKTATIGINPITSCLIVIDMQNGFAHPRGTFARLGKNITSIRKTIPKIKKAADYCRSRDIPVIFTQQIHVPEFFEAKMHSIIGSGIEHRVCLKDTWDAEIVRELEPSSKDYIVQKNKSSAFYNTWLELWLRYKKIKTVIISGCTTGYCVAHTIMDAYARDYDIVVLADGVGDQYPEIQNTFLSDFDLRFGIVLPWASVKADFERQFEEKQTIS